MVIGGSMKLYIFTILTLISFVACQEKKQSNSEKQRSQIAALLLLQSGNCTEVSLPSIGETNRIEFNFSNSNCTASNVGSVGFAQIGLENINESGLVGKSQGARLVSQKAFSKDGKVNIEVTYKLTAPDGYLDVTGNASVNTTNVTASGPTFRITPSQIKYLEGTTESAFSTTISSPVNQFKTLCLEIHEEGAGSHMFGWSKACSALTPAERGNYEFDEEDINSQKQGNGIGFVLNKVVLQKIVVSQGKIGTSGSIQFFPLY